MKINFLKASFFASVLMMALSVTSCKDKDAEMDVNANDTVVGTGVNTDVTPADTVVTDNDTVVKMGTDLDAAENPVGEQVP